MAGAILNVDFLNGHFIATGEAGSILFSPEGSRWERRETGTLFPIRDCTYGAGRYVAVGEFGTVLTSTDATNWTNSYAGTFFDLRAVTYGNGRFVAVGEGSTILTSEDGLTWTSRATGPWTFNDVLFADGRFLVAGGAETSSAIVSSPDGLDWQVALVSQSWPILALAHGDGRFAAVTSGPRYGYGSEILTSTNATDWETAPSAPFPGASGPIAFADGRWLIETSYLNADPAYTTSWLHVSEDLESWTTVATNHPLVGAFAVGPGRIVSGNLDGSISVSVDGADWNTGGYPTELVKYHRGLEYVNGEFWQTGHGQIARSIDGRHWTNLITFTNGNEFKNIAHGHGVYIIGGEYRTVWISTNGVEWSQILDHSIQPYVSDVRVCFGNGVFVGVAGPDADILTSTNGRDWSVQKLTDHLASHHYFRDVTHANGRFVAVDGYHVATSTDGFNWHLTTNTLYLNKVAGGNGTFVAVGHQTVGVSTDGTNWTTRTSTEFGSLNDIAFGGGVFVAAGAWPESAQPRFDHSPLWTTMDGRHWTRRVIPTGRDLYSLAYGAGAFLLLGEISTLFQSTPVVSVIADMNPEPRLLIQGPVDRDHRLEYRDLVAGADWQPLAEFHTTNVITEINDPTWHALAKRMYRAVLLP